MRHLTEDDLAFYTTVAAVVPVLWVALMFSSRDPRPMPIPTGLKRLVREPLSRESKRFRRFMYSYVGIVDHFLTVMASLVFVVVEVMAVHALYVGRPMSSGHRQEVFEAFVIGVAMLFGNVLFRMVGRLFDAFPLPDVRAEDDR